MKTSRDSASVILALLLGAAFVGTGDARAQTTVALSDLGPLPPESGAGDIVQVGIAGDTGFPAGLNYYLDNGSPPGQTFVTDDYAGGYTLNAVAVQTGNREGGGIGNAQPCQLRIYAVTDNLATLVDSYVSQEPFTFTFGNWLQWTGLVTTWLPTPATPTPWRAEVPDGKGSGIPAATPMREAASP